MIHLPNYYVIVSQAKMPSSCKGRYGRVGLIQVDPYYSEPRIIRDTKHATVIATWEKCFWGITNRCALRQAAERAVDWADELNKLNRAWENRLMGTDVC
jgi:hypothetical protein